LKMLNQLPNARLSGENSNQLYMTSLLQSNLRINTQLLDDKEDVDGAHTHNVIPAQSMSCQIQGIMNSINPPPNKVQNEINITGSPSLEEYDRGRILGCKTIRFHKDQKWSVKESADFLRENFPCSRIVINIRSNIKDQLNSMKKTFKNGMTTRKLEEMNDFLVQLSKELGEDMAKLVDMNEWSKDIDVLNNLIYWLGFRECKYQKVVHENYKRYESAKKKTGIWRKLSLSTLTAVMFRDKK